MPLFSEELVQTWTTDGIHLEGVVIRPGTAPARRVAVVWIHGFTGRYDEVHTVAIGRQVAARGFTYVAGNNRGHHLGAQYHRRDGSELLAGGWWEKLDESAFDVAAWIDYAVGLGYEEVVLAGHSLGKIKVSLYQAQQRDPRVAAMILASPPANIESWLPSWDAAIRAQVAKLVDDGRGTELIASPFGQFMSAQTYDSWQRNIVDVFASRTTTPALAQIRCPLLICYGTNEPEVISAADAENIRQGATAAARVDVRAIAGGDHVYTDHEDEAGSTVATWLESL